MSSPISSLSVVFSFEQATPFSVPHVATSAPSSLWRLAIVAALHRTTRMSTLPEAYDEELQRLDKMIQRHVDSHRDLYLRSSVAELSSSLGNVVDRLLQLERSVSTWSSRCRSEVQVPLTWPGRDGASISTHVRPPEFAVILLVQEAAHCVDLAMKQLNMMHSNSTKSTTSSSQEKCSSTVLASHAKQAWQWFALGYSCIKATDAIVGAREDHHPPTCVLKALAALRSVCGVGALSSQYMVSMHLESTMARHSLLAKLAATCAAACHLLGSSSSHHHHHDDSAGAAKSPWKSLGLYFSAASEFHRTKEAFTIEESAAGELPDMPKALACIQHATKHVTAANKEEEEEEARCASGTTSLLDLFPLRVFVNADITELRNCVDRDNRMIYFAKPDETKAGALETELLEDVMDRMVKEKPILQAVTLSSQRWLQRRPVASHTTDNGGDNVFLVSGAPTSLQYEPPAEAKPTPIFQRVERAMSSSDKDDDDDDKKFHDAFEGPDTNDAPPATQATDPDRHRLAVLAGVIQKAIAAWETTSQQLRDAVMKWYEVKTRHCPSRELDFIADSPSHLEELGTSWVQAATAAMAPGIAASTQLHHQQHQAGAVKANCERLIVEGEGIRDRCEKVTVAILRDVDGIYHQAAAAAAAAAQLLAIQQNSNRSSTTTTTTATVEAVASTEPTGVRLGSRLRAHLQQQKRSRDDTNGVDLDNEGQRPHGRRTE